MARSTEPREKREPGAGSEGPEDGGGMAAATYAGRIPRHPRGWYGAPVQFANVQFVRAGNLFLPLLRECSLRCDGKIRVRHGLAVVYPAIDTQRDRVSL